MEKNIFYLLIFYFVFLSATSYAQNTEPIILNISPSFGEAGSTLDIIIEGQNLEENSTLVFTDSIYLNSIKYVDEKRIIANISIASNSSEKVVKIGIVNLQSFKISKPKNWRVIAIQDSMSPDNRKNVMAKMSDDIKRENFRLEVDKYKISLGCFKRLIENSIRAYGFEFQEPVFDDENRLETYEKDFIGVINPEHERFERVIIAVWISEREDVYRLYITTSGKQRRRKNDLGSSEPIREHDLNRFSDEIVRKIDIEKCNDEDTQILVLWSGGIGLNVQVITPDSNEINYDFIKSEENLLSDLWQYRRKAYIPLPVKSEGRYRLTVNYYTGIGPVDGIIAFIYKKKILGAAKFVLNKKGATWIGSMNVTNTNDRIHIIRSSKK